MDSGGNMNMKVAVCFKGNNYLVWSRMVKTTVGMKGLWKHITEGEAPKLITQGEDEGEATQDAVEKWEQEDMLVLSVLQNSLDPAILDAYSYCESAKELWDTLKKVYGNISNLSRVYEVKHALNHLVQEDMEFSKHLGKFRSLWSELEMLRPSTTDVDELNKRREQDKVFGLLLTLNPAYQGLIQHLLREESLPELENVCARIQKEQGTIGLFGKKGELALVNQAAQVEQDEAPQANKAVQGRYEDRRFNGDCDHCKKHGHKKSQCWILHPHLKPQNGSGGVSSSKGHEGEVHNGKSLVAYTGGASTRSINDEYLKRSDLDALIKLFKANGNILGYSHHAYMIPKAVESYIDLPRTDRMLNTPSKVLEMYTHPSTAHTAHTDHVHSPSKILAHIASSHAVKPLIVDSGASHHMISDTRLIKNIVPANGNVMIANGSKIPIRGIGSPKLFHKESEAFYMPEFTSNLLSVKECATDLNCNVIFSPNDVKFQDIESSKMIGKGVTKGELYMLEDLAPVSDYSCSFSSVSATILRKDALWHARLGHPHVKALNLMVPGVHFENKNCEACILGKHCKTVFERSSTIYDKCFDLIHSDIWTAPCLSRDNHRTDNGGEYTSNAFKHHLAQHGILHQTSCPYTPQQNGVAERKNRHLMEVARSMMFQANVPKRFWSDAVVTACYLINRTPTLVLHGKSPFEVLNKYKPVLTHLKVFGCLCYVMVPGELRNKLEAKSTKENQEDLKDLTSDRASILRTILENLGINMNQGQSGGSVPGRAPTTAADALDHEGGSEPETLNQGMGESSSGQESSSSHDQGGDQGVEPRDHQEESDPSVVQEEVQVQAQEDEVQSEQQQAPVPTLRRSTRIRKDPSNWVNTRVYYNAQAVEHPSQAVCSFAQYPVEHYAFQVSLDESYVPRSYEEAMLIQEWRDSVNAEADAMIKNDTWYESALPKGKRAVSSRWIFTIKYLPNGQIDRRKTRLVARVFTQTYGEDYIDTFAPVAKLHTIRIVLSLAVNLEWDLWQMDVKMHFFKENWKMKYICIHHQVLNI
ncbi:hypothetical protein Bca4012_010388 [Brassica carinata]